MYYYNVSSADADAIRSMFHDFQVDYYPYLKQCVVAWREKEVTLE
jgi:hypothetical protein